MSMPAPHRLAVSRRVALAAGLGLAVALTGCSNHEEALKPYQPAAGVETTIPEVIMVRNLMFVTTDGKTGTLNGSIIADEDDALSKIEGFSLKTDNTEDAELKLANTSAKLPADKALDLREQKITADGLMAGGMTRLTLTFAQAQPITLMVPVVDGKSHGIDA